LQLEQQQTCLNQNKKIKIHNKKKVKNTLLPVTMSMTCQCVVDKIMHEGRWLEEGVAGEHGEQ
jgi:hypothetical protein